MISHPDWGSSKIADIQGDRVLLKFEGFAFWVDRQELPGRLPRKNPSKSEAEVFRKMGYAVPESPDLMLSAKQERKKGWYFQINLEKNTMNYLVTTYAADIPTEQQIVMVDGTVPGWEPKEGDYHFDHHKAGGENTQVEEMEKVLLVPNRWNPETVVVTTQLDADACVAAAWLQLHPSARKENHSRLVAIAYDCDHLGLPQEPKWDLLREFARNAVATLKQSNNALIDELNLPRDRKTWTAEQKKQFASVGFERSTQWLIDAALGKRDWPGENGEANTYWQKFDSQRDMIYARCGVIQGCAVLDQRGISEYIDPRHLIEWARQNKECTSNITLTIRDRLLNFFHTEEELLLWKEGMEDTDYAWKVIISAYSYTLGSIPLHQNGSPKFSDRNVWKKLSQAEGEKRFMLNLPAPSTDWGGRNEVGGSSWNDAALLLPEEVIKIAFL